MTTMRCLELRNLCISEADELVQIEYLCELDSSISEEAIIDSCGQLKNLGMANDKKFMKMGMYPLSVYYEKNGKVKRNRINPLDEFDLLEGNIYSFNQRGANLLRKWNHIQKQA